MSFYFKRNSLSPSHSVLLINHNTKYDGANSILFLSDSHDLLHCWLAAAAQYQSVCREMKDQLMLQFY